jgi:hypothetical protein
VLLGELHRSHRCATPVRSVQVWTNSGLVFVLVRMLGLIQVVVVLVVGMGSCGQFARRSPPRAQYKGGRSRSFEMERRNGPRSSFCRFCPPSAREG